VTRKIFSSFPADILFEERSVHLPGQNPSELAEKLQCYSTPESVDEYSVYRLYPEETYLFTKYYKPGDRILDHACGLGRTTLRLHEMGFLVKGLDASEFFVNIAKRRFPFLDLGVGSYDHIEAPDAAFAHVLISFNGIDHAFPEPQRITTLRECARVLKPGGTLIYSSHNIKSLHLFSPRHGRQPLWKLRNSPKAFKARAYVLEEGVRTFYASPEFVVHQTESAGFLFLEMVGFRMSRHNWITRYYSPYIYYAFSRHPNL